MGYTEYFLKLMVNRSEGRARGGPQTLPSSALN